MVCSSCGAPVAPSQRFCTSCGRVIEQLPPPMLSPVVPVGAPVAPTLPPPAVSPSQPAPGPATVVAPPPPPPPPPVAPTAVATPAAAPASPPTVRIAPAEEPLGGAWTVVEQTPAVGDAAWARGAATAATPTASSSLSTSRQAVVEPTRAQSTLAIRRLRPTPLLVAGAFTAAAALVSLAATLYSIDIDGARSVAPKLGDVYSNNMIAVVVAAVVLLAGGVLAALGSRLGAGLAGGAGLAVAGFVAMQIGTVTQEFDSAGYDRISSGGVITVTLTRDVGFWLLVVAAAAGVIAFGMSLQRAGEDHRNRMDPTVSVLGACAALMVAAGPLIPEHGVPFVRNFRDDFVPPATLYLRLASIALIALAGVLGFLVQRRWGIGLALGGIVIAAWQWISTLTVDNAVATGSTPLSVSGGNLGSIDGRPHPVTTIGVIAVVLFALLSLWLAARANKRHAGR